MLKNLSWPASLVLVVGIGAFAYLQSKGQSVPPWVVLLLTGAAVSTPKLLTDPQQTQIIIPKDPS